MKEKSNLSAIEVEDEPQLSDLRKRLAAGRKSLADGHGIDGDLVFDQLQAKQSERRRLLNSNTKKTSVSSNKSGSSS